MECEPSPSPIAHSDSDGPEAPKATSPLVSAGAPSISTTEGRSTTPTSRFGPAPCIISRDDLDQQEEARQANASLMRRLIEARVARRNARVCE